MDLKSYQVDARQTVVYPKQMANEYLAYGLMSEVGELCGAILAEGKSDVVRELGDVMWYLVNILWENGAVAGTALAGGPIVVKRGENLKEEVLILVKEASLFCDWMKKGIRDWRSLDRREMVDCANKCIYTVERICFFSGVDFYEVLKVNRDKLYKRLEEDKLHGSGDYR